MWSVRLFGVGSSKYWLITSLFLQCFGCSVCGQTPNTVAYNNSDASHPLQKLILSNSILEMGDNAFPNSKIDTIVLPDSLKVIKSSAFKYKDSLKYIVLPSHLDSIGRYTFLGCKALTEIVIPNSVTSIGNGAFKDCTSLTTIDVPSSVTSIESFVFFRCTGLTVITIPNSVKSIGIEVFEGCVNIKKIEVYWQDPPSDVSNIYLGQRRYFYRAPIRKWWFHMKYAIKGKPILSVPHGTKSKYAAFLNIKEEFRIKERKRTPTKR